MIEIRNLVLAELKDFQVGEITTTREQMQSLTHEKVAPLPIFLQVGSVRYKLGVINRIRVGGNAITGDLRLSLKGAIKMGVQGNSVIPESYIFKIDSS